MQTSREFPHVEASDISENNETFKNRPGTLLWQFVWEAGEWQIYMLHVILTTNKLSNIIIKIPTLPSLHMMFLLHKELVQSVWNHCYLRNLCI